MKTQQPKHGFIYLWKDMKRKKFYLGSHLGSIDDGYAGSNNHFKTAYKKRPHTFKRRILERFESITSRDLLAKEQLWLQQITLSELGSKYYNQKRVAAGGDIVSQLPTERRKEHRRKSMLNAAYRAQMNKEWCELNPGLVTERAKKARSQVKNPTNNLKQAEQIIKRASADAFMTPLGPRSFLTKAAEELNISYPTLRKYVEQGINGFYWLNKTAYFHK